MNKESENLKKIKVHIYNSNNDIPPKEPNSTRFVAISDTHSKQYKMTELPMGDVLLHAGDFTMTGFIKEIKDFAKYIKMQPHKHKIVIAGNHDIILDKNFYTTENINRFHRFHDKQDPNEAIKEIESCCIYLLDSKVVVEGWTIWGSPWQPFYCDWAFNLDRGPSIKEKWDLIPSDGIDILLTHGPPQLHGGYTIKGEDTGCKDLYDAIKRVKPLVHVFGHVHEGYGVTMDDTCTYINASICTFNYTPTNKPIVFDLLKI